MKKLEKRLNYWAILDEAGVVEYIPTESMLTAAPMLLAALKAYINIPILPDVGHEDELINAINSAQAVIAAAEEVKP